jgi:hypothetical protein
MGKNRVFFPQQVLDRWLNAADAELHANELTLKAERKRYKLVEAVRVIAEVSGTPDPYDITGRVKTVGFLTELGAELLGESMLIAENAYEIVPGWLGQPLADAPETRPEARQPASTSAASTSAASASDEQLLANFLARKL